MAVPDPFPQHFRIEIPRPTTFSLRDVTKWISSGILLTLTCLAGAGTEFWEQPPLSYSDTAPTGVLARRAAEYAAGTRRPEGATALDRLRFVLRELEVPEESQVLVFSKTSQQNSLISPRNPRALYFSPDAYVGYVPGGAIEAIVHDPVLGVVFYRIEAGQDGILDVARDAGNCLSCHGTMRTEGVPGVQIRSVLPDGDGHPLLALGTTQVTDATPLAERWGGYYVTGHSALPHLGNRTYSAERTDNPPQLWKLTDLRDRIDTAKYLQPTSDVVALMVLEHQCRMHNLLTAASLDYRRAVHLARTFDPSGEPDSGIAGRIADARAKAIVDALFFRHEAPLGDGLEGAEAFQKAFLSRFPKNAAGRSLADFLLYGRIFRNRCSYMIYSAAFRELPEPVKRRVFRGMREILLAPEAPREFAALKNAERSRIVSILDETLPAWRGGD